MNKPLEAFATYQTGTTDQEEIVELIERETGISFEDSSDIEYGDFWRHHPPSRYGIRIDVVDNVLYDDDNDSYSPLYPDFSMDTVLVDIGVEDINHPVFRFLLSRPQQFKPVKPIAIMTDIEGEPLTVWEGYPPIPSEYLD
ncbi:hypothetical protein [Stappia sp.]|uniref:hypothetical protein n=1 Tax=Stappia sp. TaxID=1870903 RepID=UPI003C7B4959